MKYVPTLVVSLFLLCVAAPAAAADMPAFFRAIGTVESHGNDNAVGDGGKALGRYQLWEAYVVDAKAVDKSLQAYTYQEIATNKTLAERAMLAYWQRYCPKALAALDFRTLAMTHNAGPRGPKVKTAEAYWLRVKHELEK